MQQLLYDNAQSFNLFLTHTQLNAFTQYSRALIAWNQKVNLTRIVAPEEIAVKHFLDSLSVCLVLPNLPPDLSIIDVGAGAGFPGLPLKIARPEIHLTLLESTAKKTAFLQHLVDLLQLNNVTVLTARAEEAGQQAAHREQYDVAVARAVAALPMLVEYTLPLVKVGGRVIVQKGRHPAVEVRTAVQALGILGGQMGQILPVDVPGLEAERHLVVIHKQKPTPKQYPRRPGLPAKKPIT
ncbi:MAG: 16S rRNA (guanine(527)-N(7))-methyltransferase RsmG [Anaerolineae bacterium]|nr:16S rRNA (guanine(527)-N(7))-methyltransferase RsmG [Anaerolineae bacterium]